MWAGSASNQLTSGSLLAIWASPTSTSVHFGSLTAHFGPLLCHTPYACYMSSSIVPTLMGAVGLAQWLSNERPIVYVKSIAYFRYVGATHTYGSTTRRQPAQQSIRAGFSALGHGMGHASTPSKRLGHVLKHFCKISEGG